MIFLPRKKEEAEKKIAAHFNRLGLHKLPASEEGYSTAMEKIAGDGNVSLDLLNRVFDVEFDPKVDSEAIEAMRRAVGVSENKPVEQVKEHLVQELLLNTNFREKVLTHEGVVNAYKKALSGFASRKPHKLAAALFGERGRHPFRKGPKVHPANVFLQGIIEGVAANPLPPEPKPREPQEEKVPQVVQGILDRHFQPQRIETLAHIRMGTDVLDRDDVPSEIRKGLGNSQQRDNDAFTTLEHAAKFIEHLTTGGVDPHASDQVQHIANIAVNRSTTFASYAKGLRAFFDSKSRESPDEEFLDSHLPKGNVKFFDVRSGKEVEEKHLAPHHLRFGLKMQVGDGDKRNLTSSQKAAVALFIAGHRARIGNSDQAAMHLQRLIPEIAANRETALRHARRMTGAPVIGPHTDLAAMKELTQAGVDEEQARQLVRQANERAAQPRRRRR